MGSARGTILILDGDGERRQTWTQRLISDGWAVAPALEEASVVVVGPDEPAPWRRLDAWRAAGHRFGVVLLSPPPASEGIRAFVEPVVVLQAEDAAEGLVEAAAGARGAHAQRSQLALAGGVVHLDQRCVVPPNGQRVRLSQREIDLLAYLAARSGRDVPREELLQQVWGLRRVGQTRAVDMAVSRLRKKIEPDPADPTCLLSSRGDGYRLVLAGTAPVAAVEPSPRGIVGRSAELAALEAALAAERLVSLVGPPGVGKTRLARELLGRWGGEAWFCDMFPARSRSDVAVAVASAVGVETNRQREEDDVLALIARALAARPDALLVLDNAEHLLDPIAAALSGWLGAAPRLRVLVTTQAPLRLPGEHLLPVSPLSTADGAALFLARCQVDVDPEDAARLAERLDGLPLAIELAAARAWAMAPRDMLAHLDQRFRLLAGRGRPSRHAALRTCLRWAYNLLAPHEQAALQQLSAFRGSFSLAAAAAVLELSPWPEADWAEGVVMQLAERSLLQTRAHDDGRSRYRMLDSVRLFAAAEASAAAHAETDARLRSWCAARARRLLPHTRTRGAPQALAEVAAEAGTLRRALEIACQHGHPDAGPIALLLDTLLSAHGSLARRSALLRSAIPIADRADATHLRISLAGALAAVASAEAARDVLLEAEAALEGRDQPALSAAVAAALGDVARKAGDLLQAQVHLRAALALATACADPLPRLRVRAMLASVEGFLGPERCTLADPEQALREAVAALLAREQLRQALDILLLWNNFAQNRGDHEGYRDTQRRALGLLRLLNNHSLVGVMTAREGISAMLAGDYRESIEHFSSALSTLRDNGQRLTYSRVVHYRGLSWLCLGEHGAAWDDLDAELQIVAASGDGRAEAHACEALAQLELDRCRPTDALAHAQRGLSLAAGSGDAVLHADLLLISGLIAHLGGALEEAAARYDDAEAVALTNLPPSHAALLGLLRAALGAERGQPVDLTMPSDGFALGDDLIGVAARLRGEKNEADAERTSRPPHVLARLADRAVTRALQSRQTS